MNDTFHLEILTPEKHFLSGEAQALVVSSLDGEICIMKNHMPMVVALDVGVLKIKQNGEWKNALNYEGFVEVNKSNEVSVFAQLCEWTENLEEVKAAIAQRRKEAKEQHMESVREHKHNVITLARTVYGFGSKTNNK